MVPTQQNKKVLQSMPTSDVYWTASLKGEKLLSKQYLSVKDFIFCAKCKNFQGISLNLKEVENVF
jgi:hypothetical protein